MTSTTLVRQAERISARGLGLGVRRSLQSNVARTLATRSASWLIARRNAELAAPYHCEQRRQYATPPPQVVHSDLPIEEYHAFADVTMDQLLESLENILDEVGDPEHEVEYSSGVLTLKLGDKGTYVINKQPPNKQIWLSSPVSGPKRYDYSAQMDEWVYYRDGKAMGALLERELSDALGREVKLGVEKVSSLLA